eukprot:3434727-Amphidinium_carterae.1
MKGVLKSGQGGLARCPPLELCEHCRFLGALWEVCQLPRNKNIEMLGHTMLKYHHAKAAQLNVSTALDSYQFGQARVGWKFI